MAIGQFVGILLYYMSLFRWANLIKSLFVRTSHTPTLTHPLSVPRLSCSIRFNFNQALTILIKLFPNVIINVRHA